MEGDASTWDCSPWSPLMMMMMMMMMMMTTTTTIVMRCAESWTRTDRCPWPARHSGTLAPVQGLALITGQPSLKPVDSPGIFAH